jgi:hypothetical protein
LRELEQKRSGCRLCAGTLVKLLPQHSPMLPLSPKTKTPRIPVYQADGSICAVVNQQRFERLQSVGLVARIVRSRTGQVKRAILFTRPGEPKPMLVSSVMGTRYSFKELLDHGPAWDLKRLGGNRDGKTYAPPEMRAAFLQVVADCSVPCCHDSKGTTGPKTPARCPIAQLR